ncbi:MAG: hypothetical protein H6R41_827, partial [Deltaproteobacteria bacterium]|nr:hypothetical protein [Deltaproteobacteria bacterium]
DRDLRLSDRACSGIHEMIFDYRSSPPDG